MKKFAKCISAVLVLVMALTVCMIPAYAKPRPQDNLAIQAEVKATEAGTQASTGTKVYKIEVYVNSTHSLPSLQMGLTWDTKAFKLVRAAANKADATAISWALVADRNDRECVMNEGDLYDEYGGMYEGHESLYPDLGYAQFPSSKAPTLGSLTDTNMGQTLKDKGYAGIWYDWETQVDVNDNFLLISGGTVREQSEPGVLDGKVKVLTFYLRELADAPAGNYTIGFNPEQAVRMGGVYTYNDVIDSQQLYSDFTSFASEDVTYTNAQIQIGDVASGPKVEREKGQIKMTATGDGNVADEFQFRVLSKISDADWNAYLANTGSSEDNNCLTKLGFVAYKGTEGFDMAQAQAAAKAGETQGNYYVATTNYVKHTDGSDAEFAARIDTTKTSCDDATYIAFIQYKDADGTEQYAFYDAEYTALIKTNYDSLVSQYLGQFGN